MSQTKLLLAICLPLAACEGVVSPPSTTIAQDKADFLTTSTPVTLLSANDGEERYPYEAGPVKDDSITVIQLGPDHPPVVETVFDLAPSTIWGSPHLAITLDGRYGFVANHGFRFSDTPDPFPIPDKHLRNVLSAIDVSSPTPRLVDQVDLEDWPWMLDLHPDGDKVIVSVGASFQVYVVENDSLRLIEESGAPRMVSSFDVSPRGDSLLAVLVSSENPLEAPELHYFSIEETAIHHVSKVDTEDVPGLSKGLFSPRISPDGSTALVLNDWGLGGKATLDAVWVVDLDAEPPRVTSRILQVGDGLESLAFHPDGYMAVIACLESGFAYELAQSHLGVVDMRADPPRLVAHYPIEPIPEGMEFTPDGSQLLVGTTLSHQIVVYDVDGLRLERSPFVLRTGVSPAALALAPRARER